MKLTPKASMAFKTEKPAQKVAFGTNVINCLSALLPKVKGKPDFSNLPIPVSELQDINDTLSAEITAAADGNNVSKANLKTAIVDWNEAFSTTATYVSSVADGQVAVILSTGFLATKSETQAAQAPGAATSFSVTINGSKGAIVAGCKKGITRAKTYVTAAVPPGAAVSFDKDMMIISIGSSKVYVNVGTRKEVDLYNLPSGVAYSVNMYGVNSAGSGPASASQDVIPQ